MKKLLVLLLAFMTMFTLSACDKEEKEIYIAPDDYGLIFDTPEYNSDGDFVMTIYLTNGFHNDVYFNTWIIQVWDETDTVIIAEALFIFDTTIPGQDYEEWEITFYNNVGSVYEAEDTGHDLETILVYFDENGAQ